MLDIAIEIAECERDVPSCVVDDEAEEKRLEIELKLAILSAEEKLCSATRARQKAWRGGSINVNSYSIFH